MKDKNTNASLLRNSPVRTHDERRVKLNDTYIKNLIVTRGDQSSILYNKKDN